MRWCLQWLWHRHANCNSECSSCILWQDYCDGGVLRLFSSHSSAWNRRCWLVCGRAWAGLLTWARVKSEEWPDRQLLVQGGVAQQRLLLQLLQLLRAGEVEGVRPQVRPRVDEGWAQRLCNHNSQAGTGLGHSRPRMETKLRILRGGVVNWLTRSMLHFHIWLMRYLKRSRNFHSRTNSATLSEGAVQSLRGVVVVWDCTGGTVLLTSCEGVHERGLGHARGHGRTQRRRLGLADLRVGLSELEPDGLRQVGVEPHSLLQQNTRSVAELRRLGPALAGSQCWSLPFNCKKQMLRTPVCEGER